MYAYDMSYDPIRYIKKCTRRTGRWWRVKWEASASFVSSFLLFFFCLSVTKHARFVVQSAASMRPTLFVCLLHHDDYSSMAGRRLARVVQMTSSRVTGQCGQLIALHYSFRAKCCVITNFV